MALSYANALNTLKPIQKYPTGIGLFSSGPVDVTFDTAYPSGGYTVTPQSVGFARVVLGFNFIGWKGGIPSGVGRPQFDGTNTKLVIGASGSMAPLVIEEVVTVTSNVGRLASIPGPILGIQVLAGSVTGAFRQIPVGKTPATTQVAVNMATGTLTFLTGDAVTSVAVTYIPLGVGNFTQANLVVDEAVTLATAGVNLANRAAYILYVWNDTDTTHLPQIFPVGEAPATHQIAIDINNTGATTITPNSAQNTNSALVTYFKYDATWISKHSWTDQVDIAVTSDAIALNEVLDISTIWIPGYGQVIVGETSSGTTNKQAVIQGPRGAVAANVCTFDPLKGALAFLSGDAYATIEMPYMLLSAANALPSGGALPIGANLSGLVGRFEFFGY